MDIETKEWIKLPQSTVKTFIEDVTLLFQFVDDNKHQYALAKLEESSSLNQDQLSCLSEVFDWNNIFSSPFNGLETGLLQQQYFKDTFDMIVSFLVSSNRF